MRKYNYFDDEPEEEQESSFKEKIIIYAVCAYDAVKEGIKALAALTAPVSRAENGEAIEADAQQEEYVMNRRARILKLLSVVMFLVFTVLIVVAFMSSISRSNENLKKYYSDAGKVCTEIIATHGTCKAVQLDGIKEELWQMNGLCYLRQMDFDGDKSDELLLAYSDGAQYYVEVWGYKGKDFIKFYSEPASRIETEEAHGSFTTIYNHNGKYFIGVLDNSDNKTINMYQLKGDEFKKTASTCDYDAVNDIYALKGKINSTDFETIKLSYISPSKAERLSEIVSKNLDSFVTSNQLQVAAQKTDEQIKANAYYDIVAKRVDKYGKPNYATDGELCYVDGVAVVQLIDFNADGNDELLLISRRITKVSERKNDENMVIIEVPEYRLEVYGWQDNQAVKLFENDGISQFKGKENKNAFYILRKNRDNTIDICNNSYTYGKRSEKVWNATSKIVSYGEDGFDVDFTATVKCEYGDMYYTIDGKSVYRSVFKEKGYVVPYFCNDDAYDKNTFTVTMLQGRAEDSSDLRTVAADSQKVIEQLSRSR